MAQFDAPNNMASHALALQRPLEEKKRNVSLSERPPAK